MANRWRDLHSSAAPQLLIKMCVSRVLQQLSDAVNLCKASERTQRSKRAKWRASMKKCGFLFTVAGLALAIAMAPAANAQRMFDGPPGPDFGREGGFGALHGQPTTGAPFSATSIIIHTQTLTDGTVITHTETVKEARDSQGRTFIQTLPSATGTGEGMRVRSMVRIFDPVSHTAFNYWPETKQANVLHMPEPGQFHASRGRVAEITGGPMHESGDMPAPTVESLGSKTINGVVAEGTRTTRVIPAGMQGNDKPITVTHETWISSDLKVEVMRVDTDPRRGTTTMEMTGISREEPAATLFQAPAGYAVNERTVGGPRVRGFEPEP
jgi:hypothetical protein